MYNGLCQGQLLAEIYTMHSMLACYDIRLEHTGGGCWETVRPEIW